MFKIWITRPELDARRFCEELEAADLAVSVTPTFYSLLDVEFLDLDPQLFLNSPPVGALVATSRNGVRAFSQMKDFEKYTHLPFFTVGKATGELARLIGFKDVRVGPGRAEGLLPLIREYDQGCDDGISKRIVNLRGDEQSFALKVEFESDHTPMKHQFEDVICYQMKEANELSSELINELKNNEIGAVVLMSPRTARVYSSLMKLYDLKQHVVNIQHFCLSETVADVLKCELVDQQLGIELPFVDVSSFPSQSRMIDCIKETLRE
ncbi:uroporphyrinogen-III synthase [Hyphomicrobiales bacterium 4NK60-0047b]